MKASEARKISQKDPISKKIECKLMVIYYIIESAAKEGKNRISIPFGLKTVSVDIRKRVIDQLEADGYRLMDKPESDVSIYSTERHIEISW